MAKKLNFDGYVAFHYYNEPLLYIDKILEIINHAPNNKYLLWTNGLLLDRITENNKFLSLFEYICITCYDLKNMPFFLRIKDIYKKVEIFDWELDDRLHAYDRQYCNKISCKRILFEIPMIIMEMCICAVQTGIISLKLEIFLKNICMIL